MNKIEIFKDLKQLLQKHFANSIDQIILFGSQIKGDAEADSDYDILLILKENFDWKTENKILDLCYRIDLKYDIFTDIKIISKEELKTYLGQQPFIQDALETGMVV